MPEKATRLLPRECIIHSPECSGVRLAAGDYDCKRYSHDFPGPLIVIEQDNQFRGVTWEPWDPRIGSTRPKRDLRQDGWLLTFPEGAEIVELGISGSLEESVAKYRQLRPLTVCDHGMQTLSRLKRSVTLDMWLTDGRVAHDYDDACRLLAELDDRDIAEGTLLYIPGWHAPYDTRMPAWEPAERLGGRDGFRGLIDLSKSVGAIVMPHMNFWGYDRASGLLENWEDCWTGSRWPGDWGLCPAFPIEYMQIDDPRWVSLFDRYFDVTVGDFGLEAVFLDQCGNAVASPKGDMVAATHALLQRIHAKFPDLLLGAEVLTESIIHHVPLIQAAWIMEENLGRFSPIARLMFEDRVRFIPHLFLGAAVPCRYVYTNMPLIVEYGTEQVFDWYRENNSLLGGLPSIRLDYARSGIDSASQRILEGD